MMEGAGVSLARTTERRRISPARPYFSRYIDLLASRQYKTDVSTQEVLLEAILS